MERVRLPDPQRNGLVGNTVAKIEPVETFEQNKKSQRGF